MPGIIRIDHVGIAVYDLDAAIDWYTKFLGAKLKSREINRDQKIEEATLGLNETSIQLISPYGESSPIGKFLTTKGQGVQQIAFEVLSLDNAVNYALEKNIRVIYEESKIGTNGSLINFLHPKDCFGVLIELVQVKRII
jgi:methylmalonyl-CoA/ethylmalonyl-CoA epimerase